MEMTRTHLKLGGAVVVALTLAPMLAPAGAVQSSGPTLKKIAEFDLPGPVGKRFDYLTIDQIVVVRINREIVEPFPDRTSQIELCYFFELPYSQGSRRADSTRLG